MNLKVATLNLCLGLKNKKQQVKELITTENIDILLLQETEIEALYDSDLLSFMGYNLEIEINNTKSRVGAYVRHEIKYKRRIELEGQNSHIVIIDVTEKNKTLRIINIYRSFNPHGGCQQLKCSITSWI